MQKNYVCRVVTALENELKPKLLIGLNMRKRRDTQKIHADREDIVSLEPILLVGNKCAIPP